MNNLKRRLCILTAAVMLFTMTGTGVFAANDISVQNEPTEETVNGEIILSDESLLNEDTDGAAADVEGAIDEESEPMPDGSTMEPQSENPDSDTEPLKVGAVKELTALSGYNQIKLTWNPGTNAQYYIVQRSLYGKDKFKTLTKNLKKCYYVDNSTKVRQKVYSKLECEKYTYRVYAVAPDSDGKEVRSNPKLVSKMPVRPMAIVVKLKVSKHLRSHGGKKGSLNLKRGTKIVTTRFGYGSYKFQHNGSTYNLSRISVRGAKADYIKSAKENKVNTYTTADAEFFLNKYMKHKKSRKKYMVWVSLYNQHLFLMKKKNGKWVSYKDWEVSSGKPGTPTPSGDRHIRRALNWRHDVKYWFCFLSTYSLHGVRGKSSWGNMHMYYKNGKSKFGNVMSSGCVRSPNEKQKLLWKTLGGHSAKGTWLIIR